MKDYTFRNDVLPLKDVLFRLALRITLNRDDAEDAVQETMMKVWSRREQWGTIDSMEAFCLTICRNIALDKVKRADHQQATLDESHDQPDASYHADPEQQTVARDRVGLVRQLMASLPEKQRSCMQLRDVEGKSYRDIATVMGITEQQVKVNIFRARQTIKEKFQRIEQHGL